MSIVIPQFSLVFSFTGCLRIILNQHSGLFLALRWSNNCLFGSGRSAVSSKNLSEESSWKTLQVGKFLPFHKISIEISISKSSSKPFLKKISENQLFDRNHDFWNTRGDYSFYRVKFAGKFRVNSSENVIFTRYYSDLPEFTQKLVSHWILGKFTRCFLRRNFVLIGYYMIYAETFYPVKTVIPPIVTLLKLIMVTISI